MPEKKKVYVKFEGIIVPSSSGEGLAETDKAWLVEINIPEKYSGEQVWIAKSMVKPDITVKDGNLIQGSTESWIFKKLDKKEVESAESEVKIHVPSSGVGSAQTIEVIQPDREARGDPSGRLMDHRLYKNENPLTMILEESRNILKHIVMIENILKERLDFILKNMGES